ncbi:class I SAM-dependent methyltransferase [Ramlibacter monticola]
MYALPNARARLHHEYRNLPRLPPGGGSLLDIGSGDGAFLQRAVAIGWKVVGVEPDAKAAQMSRARGLEVITGGLEEIGAARRFDVVTLNHVIEHVHDPVGMLRNCWEILKPGGTIWLDTPNSESYGHQIFQSAWRGIEAPRHLVLFSDSALKQALQQVGFHHIRNAPRHDPTLELYRMSYVLSAGGTGIPPTLRILALALCARLRRIIAPHRREFLTVTAQRPTC